MDEAAFEELVARAVEALPAEFQHYLDEVDIVVADWPTSQQAGRTRRDELLLGLYEGVPRTARGVYVTPGMPDKITIFRRTIEQVASSEEEMAREVEQVVRHEIAHHFGLDDARLKEIEKNQRRRRR
jgi:predicted Zn-dependent protease with MMP-like domain